MSSVSMPLNLRSFRHQSASPLALPPQHHSAGVVKKPGCACSAGSGRVLHLCGALQMFKCLKTVSVAVPGERHARRTHFRVLAKWRCLIKADYLHSHFPWWLRWLRICLQCGRPGFDPCIGRIPWRRAWKLTPVFLPVESHGQRNLVGYSPRGCKKSLK